MGGEHPVRELVVAHELPDIFVRIELGAFRGERDDRDIPGDVESAGGMPSRLIHEHHGVGAGSDSKRDFRQVEVHRLGVAAG